jgi:hypothetical protein
MFAECRACAWDSVTAHPAADAARHHAETGHEVLVLRVVFVIRDTERITR